MITWVTIIAGIGCVLWALQQFRMTLIYMGVLHSPVIGQLAGPQPALIRTALLDALKYASFALVFFVVSWPAFVTYLLVVMFVKSLLDFFLAVFHVGRFGSVQLTAKGRAYTAALELVPCAFYLVTVVISGYCLGWCARWGSRVGPSPPKPYLYRSEEGTQYVRTITPFWSARPTTRKRANSMSNYWKDKWLTVPWSEPRFPPVLLSRYA